MGRTWGLHFSSRLGSTLFFFFFRFFFNFFFFFLNFERVPKPKMNLILSMAFLAIAASTIAIRESDDVVEGEKSRAAVPLEVEREIKLLTRKVDTGRCPGRSGPREAWMGSVKIFTRVCCPHCHLCEYCDHCPRGSTNDPCRYCGMCHWCKFGFREGPTGQRQVPCK